MRAMVLIVLIGAGVLLGGCTQANIERGSPALVPASEANLTPLDRNLLANPPYQNVAFPEAFQRQIVEYNRKEVPGTILVDEVPGTILVDTDKRYLYYVLPGGKAIRYGVAVGEEAMAWSGVATVERKAEWPAWIPTASEIERLGVPAYVAPGPQNPMGARAMYLFQGKKDTLYRIHGTNQPEYIGQAISSGCIRMTNEDAVDLYNRVKLGTLVVVLEPSPRIRWEDLTGRI